MTRLLVRNGNVIEVRWILDNAVNRQDSVWHARILGERLTNCGKDYPVFQQVHDEPDLTKADRCQGCALVLFNIKALPEDIQFNKLENLLKD